MIIDYISPSIHLDAKYQLRSGLICNISEKPKLLSPSEFSSQDSLWISWCWGGAKKDKPYYMVTLDLIECLPITLSIHIICQSLVDEKEIKRLISQRIETTDHITFHPFKSDTIWIRDTGPSFVKTEAGEMEIAQFEFNEWGYEEVSSSDDTLIPENIARATGLPIRKTLLISEGGNREINGRGTLISVASVEEKRNPHVSRKEIETQYKNALGIKKTIWLEQGLYEDDQATTQLLPNEVGVPTYFTTFNPGGHIDQYCRFVDEKTILLAQIIPEQKDHPISQENARRLEECYKILSNSTDQNGQPFRIIRVPTGPMLFETFEIGDTFYRYFCEYQFNPSYFFPGGRFPRLNAYPVVIPTSYLNYLVVNETVIIPKYWSSGMPEYIKKIDLQVFKLFSELYPERSIRCLNPYPVNCAGGGIHCMTLNQPK